MALIACPECKKEVSSEAASCPNCGHPIKSPVPIVTVPMKKWNPGVAMLLSLVIPGAGQLYKGQALIGLFWFVVTIAGYAVFIFPGAILHLLCIVTAAMGNPGIETTVKATSSKPTPAKVIRDPNDPRVIEENKKFRKQRLIAVLIIVGIIAAGFIIGWIFNLFEY